MEMEGEDVAIIDCAKGSPDSADGAFVSARLILCWIIV